MSNGYAPVFGKVELAGVLTKIPGLTKVRRVIVRNTTNADITISSSADGETDTIKPGGYYDTDLLTETSKEIELYVSGTGTAKTEIWRAI